MRKLWADLPRKKCRLIAMHVGDAMRDGLQRLLRRAVWYAGGGPGLGDYMVIILVTWAGAVAKTVRRLSPGSGADRWNIVLDD